MKIRILFLLLTVWLSLHATAQTVSNFQISHGPYLQEVTVDGATFVFLTSDKSFSCIELKQQGDASPVRYYHSRNGLRDANNTFHAIRVENLKSATRYEYRIVSKEMRSFQPYKVTFGDSITSQWYPFQTIDPKKKGATLFVTSDIHSDAAKLEALLKQCDYKTCDAFFYAGDVMNYMNSEEAPFTSFIDTSVRLFASSIPFEVVRGNHETRGDMARTYPHFFPKKDGKIYGSYLLGDIMVVMLDCGEDKPDTHPVYAGLTDFDAYRTEQAEWLKQLVKTDEFKKATYRIVISHFPMEMENEDHKQTGGHGMYDLQCKCLPILNRANIDLMVSGHTHQFAFRESSAEGCRFPVLVGSADSAARINVSNGNIHIKAVDSKGRILLDKELK